MDWTFSVGVVSKALVRSTMRPVTSIFLTFLLLQGGFAPAPRSAIAEVLLHNTIIEHPENLSGAWEVQGKDSVYGLQIHLTTRVNGAPAKLVGVRQTFHSAVFQVYERTGPSRRTFVGNGFVDTSDPVHWAEGHLLLNQNATSISPEIHLDLFFDPHHQIWSGRFQRGAFDAVVTLRRPVPLTEAAPSSLVGTWKRSGQMNNCIHIVQTDAQSLFGWSDDLQSPGALRYANGLQPPHETFERYGSLAVVETPIPGVVQIEFNSHNAGCCSPSYLGKLTKNGQQIRSPQGGGGDWTRVAGASCVGS